MALRGWIVITVRKVEGSQTTSERRVFFFLERNGKILLFRGDCAHKNNNRSIIEYYNVRENTDLRR